MTVLGVANSRMKDFYDIWTLAANFEFDGKTLQRALENTFQNRNTELPDETHAIFSSEFAENKEEQWQAFTRKIKGEQIIKMNRIVQLMRDFLIPVVKASQQGVLFRKRWKGIWQ